MSEHNDWAISVLQKEIEKRKIKPFSSLFLLAIVGAGLIVANLAPDYVNGRQVFQGYSRGLITGLLGGMAVLYLLGLLLYVGVTDGIRRAVKVLKEDDA